MEADIWDSSDESDESTNITCTAGRDKSSTTTTESLGELETSDMVITEMGRTASEYVDRVAVNPLM